MKDDELDAKAVIIAMIREGVDKDLDLEALGHVLRNAEARTAWDDGYGLVVGAYYKHRSWGDSRRILELNDREVTWVSQFGRSKCPRQSFIQDVSGPL
jgi:hypothetical protein